MARKYHISPPGIAVHPWLTKPDVKFNADGVFTTGLKMSGPRAEALAEDLQRQSDEALEAYFEEKAIPPKDRKKWSVYVPFERLEDDDGNPTGEIQFDFKQNATLRSKDGEVINVKIAIKDSSDKDLTGKSVFGGSELRVKFSPRVIVMTSLKQVGVRLDFAAVQVIKLSEGTGGGGGFGSYEGGYVQEDGAEPDEAPQEY